MKLLIASDLHGSAYYMEQFLEAIGREKPDKVILLGDLLYHGPRNDLPRDYAPRKVIALLNGVKDKLLCVRGNCEAEVDQLVLEFPVLADYAVLFVDGITMYAIHGHQERSLPVQRGDLVLSGHTHTPVLQERDGIFYGNPGSLSIPKNNSVPGYLVYENGLLSHRELEHGGEIMSLHILKTM